MQTNEVLRGGDVNKVAMADVGRGNGMCVGADVQLGDGGVTTGGSNGCWGVLEYVRGQAGLEASSRRGEEDGAGVREYGSQRATRAPRWEVALGQAGHVYCQDDRRSRREQSEAILELARAIPGLTRRSRIFGAGAWRLGGRMQRAESRRQNAEGRMQRPGRSRSPSFPGARRTSTVSLHLFLDGSTLPARFLQIHSVYLIQAEIRLYYGCQHERVQGALCDSIGELRDEKVSRGDDGESYKNFGVAKAESGPKRGLSVAKSLPGVEPGKAERS
ncbi:hypothetical protein BV25DRAFT_1843498 [Artomyces pyxidatus]|uniref:Uncharacterized protein n=1 Tax=Artomyces pyxidatus TaxID=48021 RepID=A0ACB8SF85_9AGAM|nr:hypothetical protein BV25DRAFT_1843498 [Artomyces pyxidatus]